MASYVSQTQAQVEAAAWEAKAVKAAREAKAVGTAAPEWRRGPVETRVPSRRALPMAAPLLRRK